MAMKAIGYFAFREDDMKKGKSIAELRPDLAAQFDIDANYPLTPDTISAYSKKKISWVCEFGHKWINDPQHRMRSKHTDCPVCSGCVVTSYVNDVLTLFPHLEKEWNYEKNVGINPRKIHRASNKKVWWICGKGHEWQATICHRTIAKNPTGCPFCSGLRPIIGVNDLESQRPDIAKEWSYEHSKPLLPSQVSVASGKKVWWECKNGHVWKTSISHRTSGKKPTNCPYCDGRRAIPGKTDLATLRPELMEEWAYEKNKDLDPTKLRPHSTKTAHWRCKRGHEWQAKIGSRTRPKGANCPYCSGRLPIPGETDLQIIFPTIAKQWDYENNGDHTPSTISAASNKKFAWICERGHRWEATVASRTCQGNGCPVCYRQSRDGRNT